MNRFQRVAAVVNSAVRPLVASPRWGGLVSRWMTVVTYTGRRSGRTFSIPVGYSRSGDRVTIGVALPNEKTWWRNFGGEGAPIRVRLDGADRTGHAVSTRDDKGTVTVSVQLDAVA